MQRPKNFKTPKKSRIRDILNHSTKVDRSTNTKKVPNPFLKKKTDALFCCWKIVSLHASIRNTPFDHKSQRQNSDQGVGNFPANKNRNRFAEPLSVRIGIVIVCESKNLRIGIGIIFVRWELFANYSQISEIFFLAYIILIISFS